MVTQKFHEKRCLHGYELAIEGHNMGIAIPKIYKYITLFCRISEGFTFL